MTVNQNDILEALRAVLSAPGPDGEEGFTGPELATALGKNVATTRAALKQLLATGSAEVVQLRRAKINGQTGTLPGYRLRNGKP